MGINVFLTLISFVSVFSPTAIAGSINGNSTSTFDTLDKPNCDNRRLILNKCNATVRQHLLNQCYVVVQDDSLHAGRRFDCTWQSCNGLSLMGQKPQVTAVANTRLTTVSDYEINEFGLKSYVRVQLPAGSSPSKINSWECDAAGKCLPLLKSTYPSLGALNNNQAQFTGRYYMTLGEALNMVKAKSKDQAPVRLQGAYDDIRRNSYFRALSDDPAKLGTLSTNPYLDCAMNEKVFVWVVHNVRDSSGNIKQYSAELTIPANYISTTGKTQEQLAIEYDRELRRAGEWVNRGRELDSCKRFVFPSAESSHCMVEYENGNSGIFKTILKGQNW